jgi:hypothetical protein
MTDHARLLATFLLASSACYRRPTDDDDAPMQAAWSTDHGHPVAAAIVSVPRR